MRLTEIDLQIQNTIWFGVDKNGYIFICISEVMARIPEFVCKSKEETNLLKKYFFKILGIDSKKDFDNDLILSQKGLFCFHGIVESIPKDEDFDTHPYWYRKSKEFSPKSPLHFDQLPKNIQEIMDSHRVDVDVFHDVYMNVEHAYKEFSE